MPVTKPSSCVTQIFDYRKVICAGGLADMDTCKVYVCVCVCVRALVSVCGCVHTCKKPLSNFPTGASRPELSYSLNNKKPFLGRQRRTTGMPEERPVVSGRCHQLWRRLWHRLPGRLHAYRQLHLVDSQIRRHSAGLGFLTFSGARAFAVVVKQQTKALRA